ncbi:MAG: thioester domain-containing protein, partial [Bacilli bacterium]|nr:thioester domain-containing protein [Bacilli bacterium]
MKNRNKGMKRVLLLLIIILTFILSLKGVKAEDFIELGRGTQIHNSYVGGVNFAYKVTTTGEYLYCVDISKKTASNVRADRLLNSKIMNGGVVHILKNGYPYKNITGDKDKDYYITQTALWWYLDETTGSMNLGEYFKEKGPDRYNMRSKIKNLVNEGLAHKNDPIGERISNVKLDINDDSMSLKNGYYTSNEIKLLNTDQVEKVTVTLNNQPDEVIISKNGVDTTYTGPFTMDKSDTFQVKVKSENIKDLETKINVEVETEETGGYTVYEYVPEDSSMQHVTKL